MMPLAALFARSRAEVRAALATLAAAAALMLASAPANALEEVPYVQTPANVVDAMLELAAVGRDDYLIDLGSGDGRIVIAAARRFGTKGLGVDLDPSLVQLSKRNAQRQGVGHLTDFRDQDLFATDLSGASVVMLYLLPEVNLELRPRLLRTLRPGARVVSHDWDMGDWQPDASRVVAAPEKEIGLARSSRLMMWVVPAQVAGRWSWRQTADRNGQHDVQVLLNLDQRYQAISGHLTVGTVRFPLASARLRGDRIEISAQLPLGGSIATWSYRGRVQARTIVGEAAVGDARVAAWTAVRE